MKKNVIILLLLMLWASPAAAQQAGGAKTSAAPDVETQTAETLESFDAKLGLGYYNVSRDGSARAGEYDYLKSSASGVLDLEWDPLPHRFVVESTFLNQKDYFGEMDYAYRDVVVFNMYARDLYHNLDHLRFGPDDPTTPSPSWVDKNPNDEYAIENQMRRAFIRFKTPDFPFHLFADARTVDRVGTIQQRYLLGFTGGLNRVSRSRDIDWHSREITVGANSHLGPIEAEYSHTEKRFSVSKDKEISDIYTVNALPVEIPHNLVPDLKSSSDTIKVHTSYTGKLVAAATYSKGDKSNLDSSAKSGYQNAAGDLTITPAAGTLLILKYRHYDYDVSGDTPKTVDAVTISGLQTYRVRDAIASVRDVLTGVVRYRLTSGLTVKGEYVFDTVSRDVFHGDSLTPLQIIPPTSGTGPNFWEVASRTTKGTAKVGLTYRIMNKLSLRADYSVAEVSNPAYAMDPDRINTANASLTWSPIQRVTTLLSYGGVREKRDNMSAPLAGGSRKAERDQALGSVTVLVGKRSSLTASYMYLQNKAVQTLTYRDAADLFSLESGVPYADTAQVASLSATQAVGERLTLTGEASKSFSEGKFRNYGSPTNANATGFAEFSDLKVVETIYAAGMQAQFSKNISSELRYQHRIYTDKIDDTQDGKVSTILATVYMKW